MKYFISIIIAVVVVLLGFGVYYAGTPAEVRAEKLDEQRIRDLQDMQWEVVDYYVINETLPASQDVLNDHMEPRGIPEDPEIGVPYEYTKLNDNEFELCASFSSEFEDDEYGPFYAPPRRPIPTTQKEVVIAEEDWSHGTGRTCFTRTLTVEDEPVQVEETMREEA